MGFPVWAAAVSAQGTVKATGGSVNVPVAIGGTVVRAGDVILADDDGVVVRAPSGRGAVLQASDARVAKEAASRAAFQSGEPQPRPQQTAARPRRLGVAYVTERDFLAE